MAIIDSNADSDIMRVLSVLTELSEQLSQNRAMAVSLHSVASNVKTQSVHSQTGFVLRRFNLDKPQDVYDVELERMNNAMIADNQALQNDNRQLIGLIREYEQTVENVMSLFRTRAYEVQQHELAIMRQFEIYINERETEALAASLQTGNSRARSIAYIGRLLREVMRKLGGEDAQNTEHVSLLSEFSHPSSRIIEHTRPEFSDTTDKRSPEEPEPEKEAELDVVEDKDPERRLAAAEWALERETELAKLQQENQELRRLLNGVLESSNFDAPPQAFSAPSLSLRTDVNGDESSTSDAMSDVSSRSSSPSSIRSDHTQLRPLGGPPGTVGPYGTIKKSRAT